MNIYIANLDSSIDNEALRQFFVKYGDVESAEIAMDVFTGQSRGFGYVEMVDEASAQNAIGELNQSVWHNLTITVEKAPEIKARQGSYKIGNGAVREYRFKKN